MFRYLPLSLFLCGCADHPVAPTDDIQKNLVYKTVDKLPLQFDLLLPRSGTKPYPLIVWIHGGGWRLGDQTSYHDSMIEWVNKGYASASVQYRLAPYATYPAQTEDVHDALEYLRTNANSLGIDPERIAAVGHSAGGHLALMLGFEKPTRIKAVVNYSGITDLPSYKVNAEGEKLFTGFGFSSKQMVEEFIGNPDPSSAIAVKASPVSLVSGQCPPVLTIHGDADEVVPHQQAEILHAALKKAGTPEKLVLIPGANHFYGDWLDEDKRLANAEMAAFLEKHLKAR